MSVARGAVDRLLQLMLQWQTGHENKNQIHSEIHVQYRIRRNPVPMMK